MADIWLVVYTEDGRYAYMIRARSQEHKPLPFIISPFFYIILFHGNSVNNDTMVEIKMKISLSANNTACRMTYTQALRSSYMQTLTGRLAD